MEKACYIISFELLFLCLRYAASDAASDAVRSGAWFAAWDAGEDPQVIGRVVYRVAETKSWITVLNPELKVFEKSYNVSFQRDDLVGEWFKSKQVFEDKIQEYFEKESLSTRSKQLLKPLVNNLRRIGKEIFPE